MVVACVTRSTPWSPAGGFKSFIMNPANKCPETSSKYGIRALGSARATLRRIATVLVFCLPWFTAAAANRPNILLIVADDLGYSDLGSFGGEIETPHLDRLATEGLRLSQFYTSARCVASRASLLTGQYPHRVGLGHMIRDLGLPGYRDRVADEAVTLGEVLQAAGYRTFLSGKWHLGTNDPTQRGFEEFYGTLVSAHTFWDPDHYRRLPAGRQARQYAPGTFYGTDALTDHALDFLDLAADTPDAPWFLYLSFNAPHFPLQAPADDIAKYATKYDRGWDVLRAERLERLKKLTLVEADTILPPLSDYETYGNESVHPTFGWDTFPPARRADLARRMAIYAAMVDRLDANLGRVLERLRARGELDNTVIIFTSDNGACAEWGPHGFDIRSGPVGLLHEGEALAAMGGPGTYHSAGSGWASLSNTPWRYFKHHTHEGGIGVPFILHWPGGMKRAGEIDATPTHLIDLMPTLLQLAGATYPRNRGATTVPAPAGVSLAPLLEGKALEDRTLYFEHEGNRAVRAGEWKLVARFGRPWELYHIATDRMELTDLAAAHPARVKAMERDWERWAVAVQVRPAPESYPYPVLPPLPRRD